MGGSRCISTPTEPPFTLWLQPSVDVRDSTVINKAYFNALFILMHLFEKVSVKSEDLRKFGETEVQNKVPTVTVIVINRLIEEIMT